MKVFNYSALKDNQLLKTGRIEAVDIVDARKKVKEMGLLPISVVDSESTEKKPKRFGGKKEITVLSLREKIDFTSTLEILISSGIPIIEALMFIEQNSDSKKIRILTHEFRKLIIGGATLGETLEKYRTVFGRVFIGLVKAGEDSGELDKTLGRMIELLEKQESTKSKIISALVYPCMVIFLAVVAVLVMLVFVFPAFEEMFSSMGKELPFTTRACMNAGKFIKEYWIVCLVVTIGTIWGSLIAYQRPSVRKAVDKFILHVPLLSDLFVYSNFSNFMAVLQVSYEAGIPIVDCLFLANLTMDNFVLKTVIMQAAAKVQQGVHLSVALKAANQIPPMMTFMVATGEQSGRLGDSLLHCVSYIDKKLDAFVDRFTKLIEPILMIFIGVLVGFLGLSLYMPLFQSYMQ